MSKASVLFALLLWGFPLFGQGGNNLLWRKHTAYQLYQHDDFVTALVLKEMTRRIERNPHQDYDTLVRQASEARDQFQESRRYAETGKLASPFDTYVAVSSWAKDASKLSKNPIILGLGETVDLATRFTSGINTAVTTLDGTKAFLLEDDLRRAAYGHVDVTLKNVQELSQANASARRAFDAILSSVNVKTSDGPDEIKVKSPGIYTLGLNEKLLNGQLTATEVDNIVHQNLQVIVDQQADGVRRVKGLEQALLQEQNEQNKAILRAKAISEKQEEEKVIDLKVEAAHSAIYLVTSFIPDKKAAMQIELISESLIRGYQAFRKYSAAVAQLGEKAAGYAELTLLGSEVGVVMAIASAFMPQEDSSEVILKGLEDIRKLLIELYDYVKTRFDRLEDIMDSYQRASLAALDAILVQGSITRDRVEQIRSELWQISRSQNRVLSAIQANEFANRNTEFVSLQRECYGDKAQHLDEMPISSETFLRCIRVFARIALDDSMAPPFSYPTAEKQPPESLARFPYNSLDELGAISAGLGSAFDPTKETVANPTIWSNASLSIAQTIYTWPEYQHLVTDKRLKTLIDRGNVVGESIKTIFTSKQDCSQPTPCNTNSGVLTALLQRHAVQLEALGSLFFKLADQYSEEHLNGINPFRFRLDDAVLSARSEAAFQRVMPDSIYKCESDKGNFPRLPLPRRTVARIDQELKLAQLLDPENHTLSACYSFDLQDAHYYDIPVFPGNLHYFKFAKPIIVLEFVSANGTGEKFYTVLGTMFYGRSSEAPGSGWTLSALTDMPKRNDRPMETTVFPNGVYDWWAKTIDGPDQFESTAKIPAPGLKEFDELGELINRRMQEEEHNIARNVFVPELTKGGDVTITLKEIDATSSQIRAYLQLGLPRSSESNPFLLETIIGDNQIVDSKGLMLAARLLTASANTTVKNEFLHGAFESLLTMGLNPHQADEQLNKSMGYKTLQKYQEQHLIPEIDPQIENAILILTAVRRDAAIMKAKVEAKKH